MQTQLVKPRDRFASLRIVCDYSLMHPKNELEKRINFHAQELKGFTLVELLVVVGIASVLLTIASSSYDSLVFQARQTEAKTQIATWSTAIWTFGTEWNIVIPSFLEIGYKPEGRLRYRTMIPHISSIDPAGSPVQPAILWANYFRLTGRCNPSCPAFGTWLIYNETSTYCFRNSLSPGAPGNKCRYNPSSSSPPGWFLGWSGNFNARGIG